MKTDVLIVGAGLVGAALAASLGGRGLSVGLIDAAAAEAPDDGDWDARVYAISPGSATFLERLGAWSRLRPERIQPVAAMAVRGDGGDAELRFSAYEAGLRALCFIVEGRELRRSLAATLAGQDEVAVRHAVRPCALAIGEDRAVVDLEDGGRIEARLLVGADGAQSWVREAARIEARVRPYGQHGVVAHFQTERHHGQVARQWFRRDGVLALLPLPGNRVSMVWSTWHAAAERLVGLDAADLAREVERAAGHALGALRPMGPALAFPLQWMRADECVRPRIALVGDAAHSVHPLAGQGVNLGFQDAQALAGVLAHRGAQDDCGDWRLLRRHARARSEPVALMQMATDGLQRLFNNETPGLGWLRNTGLRLTNGVVPLKRLFVAHALG